AEATSSSSCACMGCHRLQPSPRGRSSLSAFADPGAWGAEFSEILDAYTRTAGLWIVGEDMPRQNNRVTLNSDVTDQHGLPVPDIHFDDHDNDVAMREHAYRQSERLYEAVGALGTHRTPPYPSTHNLGTCRMSADPQRGVVDRWGRAHDVPNLFI